MTVEPCRIMVVDDSAVIRSLITRALETQPDFKVVAKAGNGEQAVTLLKQQPVDVIILDIEMPVMDGLAALPLLKKLDTHVQIIMASTLTQRNADISLKAMTLGAVDYLPKPTSAADGGTSTMLDEFNRQLIEKTRAYGAVARRLKTKPALTAAAVATPLPAAMAKSFTLRPAPVMRPDVIAIGASTGGPQALVKLITGMGKGLPQPIFITQHLSPFFTASLAKTITQSCGVECFEGIDGLAVRPGQYYLAPGDYHMRVNRKPAGTILQLAQDPPQNFCRPSVDPMLQSVSETYGRRVLAVILTGMGQDGKIGCARVVEQGGCVLAQDEATSVVWGMPGAVAMAGYCAAVLPLDEIGVRVRRVALGGAA